MYRKNRQSSAMNEYQAWFLYMVYDLVVNLRCIEKMCIVVVVQVLTTVEEEDIAM